MNNNLFPDVSHSLGIDSGVRQLERHHRQVHSGLEHALRRFRIALHVKLRDRTGVPSPHGAAHEDDAQRGYQLWIHREKQRDVRERAGGDELELERIFRPPPRVVLALAPRHGLRDGVHGLPRVRLPVRRRYHDSVEPAGSVDLRAVSPRPHQRLVRALEHRHVVLPDEVKHPERVLRRRFERRVPAHGAHAHEMGYVLLVSHVVGIVRRQNDGHRVVVPRIAVEPDVRVGALLDRRSRCRRIVRVLSLRHDRPLARRTVRRARATTTFSSLKDVESKSEKVQQR
eukprot:31130-Pelagococcus_subviridis.AAC.6